MKKANKRTGFAMWRAQLADRLARSSHVFLITLIVLLGIEIVVDWNQTLVEINVLRDQIRQKGLNYVGLLSRAAVEPILAGDRLILSRLSTGILDDEDAIYVRITDPRGRLIFAQLDADFAQQEARQGREPFPKRYAHFLARDAHGVTQDFDGFRERLANSRYRDFPQIWSDLVARLSARFSTPPTLSPSRARIVYQDRLRDAARQRDDTTTWAIAAVDQEGEPVGAILVAFDMARTNRAVRNKYIKGLAIVLFFVGLILFQNVVGRRDKLRLLDIEQRYARAKAALREVLPVAQITAHSLTISGALEQARGSVDGLVWDVAHEAAASWLLVIDPDGDGIDAAAIALHIVHSFRKRRQSNVAIEVLAEITALGAATREIPLTRPIGIVLLRIDNDGSFAGVHSDFASLRLVDLRPSSRGAAAQAVTSEKFIDEDGGPEVTAGAERDADHSQEVSRMPLGLVGPLYRTSGVLPVGFTLLCTASGTSRRGARVDIDALVRYLLRGRGAAGLGLEDAATWARGRHSALAESDIVLVTVRRDS